MALTDRGRYVGLAAESGHVVGRTGVTERGATVIAAPASAINIPTGTTQSLFPLTAALTLATVLASYTTGVATLGPAVGSLLIASVTPAYAPGAVSFSPATSSLLISSVLPGWVATVTQPFTSALLSLTTIAPTLAPGPVSWQATTDSVVTTPVAPRVGFYVVLAGSMRPVATIYRSAYYVGAFQAASSATFKAAARAFSFLARNQ